jgi:hypothetical protein
MGRMFIDNKKSRENKDKYWVIVNGSVKTNFEHKNKRE